jgi:hypothetical protein
MGGGGGKRKQHILTAYCTEERDRKALSEYFGKNTRGKILIAECNVYYSARARYTQCDTMAIR